MSTIPNAKKEGQITGPYSRAVTTVATPSIEVDFRSPLGRTVAACAPRSVHIYLTGSYFSPTGSGVLRLDTGILIFDGRISRPELDWAARFLDEANPWRLACAYALFTFGALPESRNVPGLLVGAGSACLGHYGHMFGCLPVIEQYEKPKPERTERVAGLRGFDGCFGGDPTLFLVVRDAA